MKSPIGLIKRAISKFVFGASHLFLNKKYKAIKELAILNKFTTHLLL